MWILWVFGTTSGDPPSSKSFAGYTEGLGGGNAQLGRCTPLSLRFPWPCHADALAEGPVGVLKRRRRSARCETNARSSVTISSLQRSQKCSRHNNRNMHTHAPVRVVALPAWYCKSSVHAHCSCLIVIAFHTACGRTRNQSCVTLVFFVDGFRVLGGTANPPHPY